MKGLFIPGITAEMFRSGCLESIESLMSEGEIFNIDYNPRHIPAIRDKLWEIQRCSNCILKPEKKIVEIKPQWIPVTERLPENEGLYLIFHKSGKVFLDKWLGDDGWDSFISVTAWMPLPEPYEEADE